MTARPERVYLFRGSEILLPLEGGSRIEPNLIDGADLPLSRLYPAIGLHCFAAMIPIESSPLSAAAPGVVPSDPGLVRLPGLPPLKPFPFRSVLAELPHDEACRASKGLALLNWLVTARYCGTCRAELEDDGKDGYTAGARRCPTCGRVHYPRVTPAVIVLVRHEGKILLAHNAAFPPDRFGLLAGFVEPGESLEEAARREIREEAGIEVGDLRYRASQPWPFPYSLMIGYTAEWVSGEARPDGTELTELRWCGPGEFPSIPPPGSIARRLIDEYCRDVDPWSTDRDGSFAPK